ncbi:NADPH-dependent 1-acyl dihydroxyacetone phosphate reductase [Paramarasmius palmivorus]|uniref:NADPH-dependent 1-acyl dihydroxyacetone phosphate reductase n=1 Tax=Paramarasmius palmivorus TaxID=297713 RepID=A0AAW0E3M7_9AGAR
MSQKVVLVTGCSQGGIGFALCEEFASRGCKVYATARDVRKMEGLKDPNIEKLSLDITNDADVQRVVKAILLHGPIDILVNNAGIMAAGPLVDQTMEFIQEAFDANTFSVLRLAKAVIPSMASRKSGIIVNIGSVVGDSPTPWNGLYSATKSAVSTISEVLNMECRPFNIHVMNVEPAAIRSNISKNQQARFNLPPDSLYTGFLPNIIQRIHASQGPNSMPNEQFAKLLVQKVLSRSPPLHLILGGGATMFTVFRWLPRTLLLWLMWRVYSKKLV